MAFSEARDIFEKKGTTDLRKKHRLESLGATSLEDILVVVENARLYYDKDQSGSKIRRYMEQVSERIHYYGNIMDVFVQHHPEYVSLAWGTMKLLFGVSPQSRRLTWCSSLSTYFPGNYRAQKDRIHHRERCIGYCGCSTTCETSFNVVPNKYC